MAKAFNILDIRFENENLVLTIDNQLVTLKLSDISEKLVTATYQERRDFKIDENLSINGLLMEFECHRSQ